MHFSVVIPTYNRHDQTVAAVRSALAQRSASLQVDVVVVDDGSTDGSMQRLAGHFAGEPVRVLANTRRKGPAGARNTGILAAGGEVIALLDSDDLFLEGHLADCERVLAAGTGVDVVFGRARYEREGREVDYMGPNFDRKLALASPIEARTTPPLEGVHVFGLDFFDHLLALGCFFNLSTVALRREAARELMREELRVAEDYEFWVRLSRHHVFACLDRPQIRYTLHGDNISFEAAGSAVDNAPSLLAAYAIMRSYPSLAPRQRQLIDRHISGTLFDWAYRCRLHHQLAEAARLHLRSARFGLRASNGFALLKLGVRAMLPRSKRTA